MVKNKKIYLDVTGTIKTCAICFGVFFIYSNEGEIMACMNCKTVYQVKDGLQVGVMGGYEHIL